MNEAFLQRVAGKKLVLPFFLVAAVFLVIFSLGVGCAAEDWGGHYFQPHLLALTHVLLLGFCTMIIFGALYQLLPVLSEKKIYSHTLVVACCILLPAGTVLLGIAFWNFTAGPVMETGAVLVTLAVIAHVINVQLTLRKATATDALDCIGTAHLWLLATVVIGALLAFNFRFAFLPKHQLHYLALHAHLGLAGWFLLLVMGVASKLLPMFLLSGTQSTKPVKVAYYLMNAALCGFLADVLLTHSYARAGIYLVIGAAAVVAFFVFVRSVLRGSLRKKKDESMRQSLIAMAILIVPLLLDAMNALPGGIISEEAQLRTARLFGITFLPGFIVMLILGQTFKTLPFILWLDLKSKYRLPAKWMPRDLYSPVMAAATQWTWNAGLLLLVAGSACSRAIIVKVAAVLLMVASLLYLCSLLYMLRPQKFSPLERAEK